MLELSRWWLFIKKQARSQQLLPTQVALHQAVPHVHYHLLVWNKGTVPKSVLPLPECFGWKLEEEENAGIPVMITLPPASEAIIHLVKCKCMKERCANNRCKCRMAGLTCIDLGCSDTGEDCKIKSVVVNDNCNDEGDDIDEGEYEYISESDGEFN